MKCTEVQCVMVILNYFLKEFTGQLLYQDLYAATVKLKKINKP